MKKQLLLSAVFLLISHAIYSQFIHEQVDFDNPADLSDHFYGGFQSMVQIPTNGVTGGCLDTPDSINWGNDNSRYCSKYLGHDTLFQTRIIFYYTDSAINPNSYDRAASIWLQPHTNPNHYLIGSFSHDKKLELLSYFAANSSISLTLTNNHWYMLSLENVFQNDSVTAQLYLHDKGPSGMISGIYIADININFSDSVLTRDNATEISIIGSKSGGGIYLDNFQFNGYKSADSCLTSGVENMANENNLKLIRNGDRVSVNSVLPLTNYSIYDLNGKTIRKSDYSIDQSIDISGLENGIYFFRFDGIDSTIKFPLY